MNAGFKPFNLEELSLIPTACVYRPRVVKRSTNAIIIMHPNAMKIGVGMGIPGKNPPYYANFGSLITGSSLLLTQAAMERPAVNRIKVATMG